MPQKLSLIKSGLLILVIFPAPELSALKDDENAIKTRIKKTISIKIIQLVMLKFLKNLLRKLILNFFETAKIYDFRSPEKLRFFFFFNKKFFFFFFFFF